MTIAIGVNKEVRIKRETTFGTIPSTGSAQLLRRTESTLDLNKAAYGSSEIRTDYQVADMRHGMKTVAGALKFAALKYIKAEPVHSADQMKEAMALAAKGVKVETATAE